MERPGAIDGLAASGVRRYRGRSDTAPAAPLRSLRLAVQDVALSRRKQGFDSPRERQQDQQVGCRPPVHPGILRRRRRSRSADDGNQWSAPCDPHRPARAAADPAGNDPSPGKRAISGAGPAES